MVSPLSFLDVPLWQIEYMFKWILTVVVVYLAYQFLIKRPQLKPPDDSRIETDKDEFTDYEEIDD